MPKYGTLAYEYFKLKEFKKQQAQEGLSDFPLRQVIKPSQGVPFLYSKEKEHRYLRRQRDAERNLSEQGQLFPPVYYTYLAQTLFCPITVFQDSPLFIKYSIKTLRFKYYYGLHFFMKVLVSCKTFIK